MNGHYDQFPDSTCHRYGLPKDFAGVPVWATASSSNMGRFVPPLGVHTVWICADYNEAGISNGGKLLESLQAQGITANWLDTGNEEIDYNEYYRRNKNADEC